MIALNISSRSCAGRSIHVAFDFASELGLFAPVLIKSILRFSQRVKPRHIGGFEEGFRLSQEAQATADATAWMDKILRQFKQVAGFDTPMHHLADRGSEACQVGLRWRAHGV